MNRNIYTIFTAILLLCVIYAQETRINSKLGEIVGNVRTLPYQELTNKNVHEFLGIPFAEAPIGDLRFRKSTLKTTLKTPFHAKEHAAICPQITLYEEIANAKQSEDCLFLNIYVPERPADKPSGHAVMIWVYGGGFLEGAARYYDGALMAASGNVIVVTFNYRLGALGFLSTDNHLARGNFGLWDQQLAFQWVHDYIGDFGGDNQRVTISGESAGAFSVVQHALTPANHGLFQRIIPQSGSTSSPLLNFEREGMKDTLVLAKQLKCPTTMDELMSCLRQKTVSEYMSALSMLGMNVSFAPIVDGDLVKINAQHLSKMSQTRELEEVEFFRSLDIMSGFNAYEGAFVLSIFIDPTTLEQFRPTKAEMMNRYLPTLVALFHRKVLRPELMHLIAAQYTNWTNPDHYESIRIQLAKLGGDAVFAVPQVEMARLHKKASSSKNFMYHFAPRPSVGILQTPSWIPGANHADEINFVFGNMEQLGVGPNNAWEIDLIISMMTYWTNFIKTGDPNLPEPIQPYWPEYSLETGDYIELGKSMSGASVKQHFYAEETNFWLHVFPDLLMGIDGKDGDIWCEHHTSGADVIALSKIATAAVTMIMALLYVF